MSEQHHFVNGGITNAPFLHKKLRLIEKLNFWTFFEIKIISSEKRHARVKLFSKKPKELLNVFYIRVENDILFVPHCIIHVYLNMWDWVFFF